MRSDVSLITEKEILSPKVKSQGKQSSGASNKSVKNKNPPVGNFFRRG
jgi:hypothetical protein